MLGAFGSVDLGSWEKMGASTDDVDGYCITAGGSVAFYNDVSIKTRQLMKRR